jgi:hypothetical protein
MTAFGQSRRVDAPPLDASERSRLRTAMGEVERLIRTVSVKVAAKLRDSADAPLPRRVLSACRNVSFVSEGVMKVCPLRAA